MKNPSAPSTYTEGFERAEALDSATTEGRVSLSGSETFKGDASLKLQRDKVDMNTSPTSAQLVSFPVCEGLWDLSAALRCSLFSPDSSYNGTVRFEVLNAENAVVATIELAVITGTSDWRVFRKRIELTAEAVAGRFVVRMEKTYGEVYADELIASYAGPNRRVVAAIKFSTSVIGNLFFPGDPIHFGITVECLKPLSKENQRIACIVRDYWGAEFSELIVTKLNEAGRTDKGRFAYTGALECPKALIEIGKYYEVHGEMFEPELSEPARERSTFAVLPVPVTKQYKPLEIPFTASGWNPGIPGFFPLCDRLGFRVANVYSGWSSEPPYKCHAPGMELVKELGMGALMSSMVNIVEGRRAGYEAYTETVLREGVKRMILKYKDDVPIIIRNGNEPHPADEAQALEMINAYRAVYEGVKEVDPSIIVTSTSCGAEEQFFRLGFQKYYDVYDFHQYADAEVISADFDRYDRLVEEYGGRKPVWSTEIGQNSQGMSREAVAIQMVKIFTNFFACGGQNASWFGMMWPDPDGSIVGSNGDSFDIFHSKYSLYCPKLTAVTEYNIINAICIKKVVASRKYEGKASLTLFRDAENRCLLVAWKDGARQDVFLPMPGVGTVKATHLDGSQIELDAQKLGVTLTLRDEPILLEFDSADLQLPEVFGAPVISFEGALPSIMKGGKTTLTLNCGTVPSESVQLVAPPHWVITRETAASGKAVFCITAPERTAAREVRLFARWQSGSGELALPLQVVDAIEIRLAPSPFQNNLAGMGFSVLNHGPKPTTLHWSMAMPEVFPMAGGTFKLNDPQPFAPVFAGEASGEISVAPGAEGGAVVQVKNLAPHSLYKAILEVIIDGQVESRERLVGGYVGIPKVAKPVIFDGTMGDPAWQHAPEVTLDQAYQFAVITARTARRDAPEDLSGRMKFLWDDDYLYIGMAVQDSVFCNPSCDSSIWRGDGLQFLVDPCRASADKPGKYDYCLGLGTKGPQVWCGCTADASRAPTEEVTDFLLKITPTGHRGDMVYEVAIPWHRLSPFEPKAGANLGLAMILNNDDGQIRDSFMAWFGCAHSKQMSMNGDLILL